MQRLQGGSFMNDKELFMRVFVRDPEGAAALARLKQRFYDQPIYAAGGDEGDRETAYRAGQRETVAFILRVLEQK